MKNKTENRYFLKLAKETSAKDVLTILVGLLAIRINNSTQVGITTIEQLIYELKDSINRLSQKQEVLKVLPNMFQATISGSNLENRDIFDFVNTTNEKKVEDIFELIDELSELLPSSTMHNNSIDKLMLSLASIKKDDTILDPSSNSSRFLQLILKKNPEQHVYLQGINILLDQILALRVIFYKADNTHIYEGDVLENPKYIENNTLQVFDKIITIPPFGLKVKTDVIEKNTYNRYRYGIIPKSRADYAYVSNAISSLKEDGKAIIILPVSDLSRGGAESYIRKRLVDLDLIEAVIKLPTLLFQRSMMAMCVLIVNKSKKEKSGKIIFINADQDAWRQGIERQNTLNDEIIEKICDIYQGFKKIDGISNILYNEQIIENKGNLTVENYVYPTEVLYDGSMYRLNWQRFKNSDVFQLRNVVDFVRGVNCTSSQEVENGNIKVIKINNIQDDQIQFSHLSSVSLNVKNSYLLQKNDILISIRGSIGKLALFDKEFNNYIVNGNMVAMRTKKSSQVSPKWIFLFLKSALGQIMLQQANSGSLISNLSLKALGELRIPIIPLKEQNNIIEQYEVKQEELVEQERQIKMKKLAAQRQLYERMGISNFISKIE